jgi:mono/diheme cytochrome c family protein
MNTRTTVTTTLLAAVLGAGALSAVARGESNEAKPVLTKAERVARGGYLVKGVGCADCHTPLKMGPKGPERDQSRMFSGHPAQMVMPPAPQLPPGPWLASVGATMTAWAGPWGTSFTANLTPDKETGLGGWTTRNFIETIRNGRHLGRGRPLLPPMPFEMYANFTDDDLESIFAYLQSIPAVKNRVPQPLPPAPAPTTTAAK